MKKLLLIIVILFPVSVHAALRAPVQTTPLQPLPANTAPNLNGNINTTGNDYNSSQAQIQEQIDQSNNDEAQVPADENSPSSDIAPGPSSMLQYWILLFLGIVGLIGVGIWGYIRFVRNK